MLMLRNALSLSPNLLSLFGSAKVRTFSYYTIPSPNTLFKHLPIPSYHQQLTVLTPSKDATSSSFCPIYKFKHLYLYIGQKLKTCAIGLLNDIYLKQIRIVRVFHL